MKATPDPLDEVARKAGLSPDLARFARGQNRRAQLQRIREKAPPVLPSPRHRPARLTTTQAVQVLAESVHGRR